MGKINIPLSRQVFVNSAKTPNGQLLQNMYSVPNATGETSDYTLRQRYGSKLFVDTGELIRGFAVIKDVFYAVGTTNIRTYNSSGTLLSSVAFTTSTAQYFRILDNASGQVAFLDTLNGTYRVLEGGTLYSPSFPSGFTSNAFVYMSGYFIFNKIATQDFFISKLLDGRTFNALDFSNAVEKSDNVIGLASTSSHLYIFGTDSVEIFQNTDNVDFPFQKVNGASNTSVGAFNFTSIVSELGSVFFLSRDSCVYEINGYDVKKISTVNIDTEIRNIIDSQINVRSYVFVENGMYFYALTIQLNDNVSGSTFCYNLMTKEWHKRKTAGFEFWRMVQPLTFNNKSYGFIGTAIYELTNTEFKDVVFSNNVNLERIFTTEFIEADSKRVIHHAIQVIITTGTTDTGLGTPTISMSYSDDGGFTYSTARTKSLGDNLQYGRKVEFRNLGISRKRIYKFEITANVEISVSNCKARLEVEDEE